MLAIQGTWAQRRYGGFVGARDVVLRTRSANFPVSEVAVRIDNRGARLAPVRITLAPRVALEAEGSLERGTTPLRYELTLSTRAVPLRDVLNFGRALGMRALQGWDAVGSGTASFRLMGSLRLPSRPVLKGQAELRAARLVIPGVTEPINVPRASVQVNGDHIVVDRMLAVLGTSVFSGRLEHQGDWHSPWSFDLRGDKLNLAQGTSWFTAFGRRKPIPLFQRFPGLSSFAAGGAAASNLFASLNAHGSFSASKVTYPGHYAEQPPHKCGSGWPCGPSPKRDFPDWGWAGSFNRANGPCWCASSPRRGCLLIGRWSSVHCVSSATCS